jgi:hypothetical protein
MYSLSSACRHPKVACFKFLQDTIPSSVVLPGVIYTGCSSMVSVTSLAAFSPDFLLPIFKHLSEGFQ